MCLRGCISHGENRIRRIAHGHTHYFNTGLEIVRGLYFDTTGGTQRNTRVLIGKNNRPIGCIAYVSPDGCEGILDPIGIQPDDDLVQSELDDKFLAQRNATYCADAIMKYYDLATQKGIMDIQEPEGR